MTDFEHVQLAHGGGGQLTAELIRQVILPAVGGPQQADRLSDAAEIAVDAGKIAFTTDTYVVRPLEFPGGDIGKLAVCGTINDLAVAGARPAALSIGIVAREGLEIALLRRVLASAGRAAREAGVAIVTGDTKVVGREALDGLVINSSGVGQVAAGAKLGFDRVSPGDRIVLSGPLGEHGLAIMSQREALSFSAELASDCAAIHGLTSALIGRLGAEVRFMRDPTRGGLATVVVELAAAVGMDIELQESAIPVNRTARAAAEMLGLDLLTIANEGKLVAVVSPAAAEQAVAILAEHEIAREAAVIGTIGPADSGAAGEAGRGGPDGGPAGLVELLTRVGGRRIVQMPYGEELPRIC